MYSVLKKHFPFLQIQGQKNGEKKIQHPFFNMQIT